MNRFYLLALMATAAAMSLSAQSKFDNGGRLALEQVRSYLANPTANNLPNDEYLPFKFDQVSRGGTQVSVYVTLNAGYTAADVEAQGLEVIVDCDDMVQAVGSLDQVMALEQCDFVKALSFGEKRIAMLDKARAAMNIDNVHTGYNLGTGYKGSGVVAGIFDVGFDPNHANFYDEDGNTRVGSLWHFTGNSGTFKLYGTPEKIAGFTTDNSNDTHGTHTAGCMAGSYNRRGGGTVALTNEKGDHQVGSRFTNPYYGMAPEATLAISCGSLYDANITAGVQKIIEYAEELRQPAVVNLSIGSMLGPHDGSDATSQFLSRMGKRAIICMAAGNDGDTRKSLVAKFTSTNKTVQTFYCNDNGYSSGVVDIYSNSATPFTTTLMIYDLEEGKAVYSYDIKGLEEKTYQFKNSADAGTGVITDAAFDRAYTGSNIWVSTSKNTQTNKRYSVRLSTSLIANRTHNTSGRYAFAIKISGDNGQIIHMTSSTTEFTGRGRSGFADGSNEFSISSMACGDNVLCVGAWNTRKFIPCLGEDNAGGTLSYTDWGSEVDSIAGYSSWGELYDGRQLPHVCAPGTGIISSISTPYYNKAVNQQSDLAYIISANQKYKNRNNYWQYMQGTSMSTPIVAGAIATWLQADPTLTIDEVKDLVAKYAVKDQYVTGAPHPIQWGAGKFDAYGPIKELLANGVNDVALDRNAELIVERIADDTWSVGLGSDKAVNVSLYNMQGALVATAAGDGAAEVTTAGLAPGIYVMSVNGTHSTRVAVQ